MMSLRCDPVFDLQGVPCLLMPCGGFGVWVAERGFSLPCGRFGFVSRKSHSLFREIKSAISLFSGRCTKSEESPLLHVSFKNRRFNFLTCVSWVRFAILVGCVFCAFGAMGAPPPRASRSPARRYERSRTLALDLGKGLTPPLATGVDMLHGAISILCICGQFLRSCVACDHINIAEGDTFNSAFRIPNS